MAGYGVVDLTAYYSPMKDLNLSAGLFNVFDKKYLTYQDVSKLDSDDNKDFHTQPGRNFSLSAQYEF